MVRARDDNTARLRYARAMLVECSHCGAPLDVRDSTRLVKCAYCDHANRVRSMHTIAAETPQGWKPLPQWTPPPSKRVSAQQPLVYHETRRPRRSFMAGLSVFLTLIGVAVPVVFGVLPALQATGHLSRIGNAVGIPTWDGTSPFACGGNDTVVIEGVTAVLPQDTALTVEVNCDLRIVGSTITARRGIRADGNGRVVIEKSRIETTSTAIWAEGNKRIELIDSEITAQETAIRADGNVEVSLSGGRVSGAPAVSLRANAELDNQHAEIVDLASPAPAKRPARRETSDEPGRRSRRSRDQKE
jgi:DNA-directed RNA polymerase subunit RPC12/RpoP